MNNRIEIKNARLAFDTLYEEGKRRYLTKKYSRYEDKKGIDSRGIFHETKKNHI